MGIKKQKDMKKSVFILVVFALAGLTACRRADLPQEPAKTVTYHASQGDKTKSQLMADGSIVWSPGDAIHLFFGNISSACFASELTAPSANADFTGDATGLDELSDGMQVWAVYPYADDQVFDGSTVTLSVPDRQQAVAGSFQQGIFPSMAKTTDLSLKFYNLCGGVKFSLSRSGIKRVRFAGNKNETLAGIVKARFDPAGKPMVQSVVSGAKEIVVEAPEGGTFAPGTWYYIVALPATLSKGYTLSFEGDSPMGSRKGNSSVTIKRAEWGVLEQADGLHVNAETLSFGAEGGSSTLKVLAGGSWKATCDASWCTVGPVSWTSSTDVVLQVAPNETETPRSATVVFELSEDASQRCTLAVNQRGVHVPAPGIDWDRPFHHKSLVMRFTADWCGYCPLMGKAVNLALQQHPGKLEAVNVHGGGSLYEFSQYTDLANQYHVQGYPTGYVDGRREVQNYSAYTSTAQNINQYMTETEANYPVSSAIGLKSSLTGRKLSLDMNLFLREPADYKVTVLLLESGIIGSQIDYYEGNHTDYHHDLVARMALTNVTGDRFTTEDECERKDLQYTANIPANYVLDNMTVLVYVQRAFGTLPVLTSGNYGGYFVDNAVSGYLGVTLAPAVD